MVRSAHSPAAPRFALSGWRKVGAVPAACALWLHLAAVIVHSGMGLAQFGDDAPDLAALCRPAVSLALAQGTQADDQGDEGAPLSHRQFCPACLHVSAALAAWLPAAPALPGPNGHPLVQARAPEPLALALRPAAPPPAPRGPPLLA